MPRLSSIQWKALFLLVTFTASFSVFCHCECSAAIVAKAHHHSCCDKMSQTTAPEKKQQHGDCQGMQAVRFHLLEKQAADHVHPAPAPLTAVVQWAEQPVKTLTQTEKRKLPQQWSYKHSPPNRLSLYQCFLI